MTEEILIGLGFALAFVPIGTIAASNPEPISKMLMLATQVALTFLPRIGKSADQIEAEYWLSSATNSIESAMVINRWAFWSGLIPVDGMLSNYNFLWAHLENAARQVRDITPAQAARTISDRDYGGKWAYVWRGFYRDDMTNIATNESWKLENGYLKAEWQKVWDDKARYAGIAPIVNPEALPTPIGDPSNGQGGIAGLLQGGIGKVVGYGALAYAAWRIIR